MQYNNTLMFWFSLCISAILISPRRLLIAASPLIPPSSARTSSTGNALKDASDIYTLAKAQLMMDQVPSGKVSFKPHDLEDVNVRPVYDPGDGEF